MAHDKVSIEELLGHRAISFDLGAAVPESHLPDLAHRYGGKVQLKAERRRFLLELGTNVDRSGTGHGRPESVNRKVHAEKCFPKRFRILLILPRTSCKPFVVARPALASVNLGPSRKQLNPPTVRSWPSPLDEPLSWAPRFAGGR